MDTRVFVLDSYSVSPIIPSRITLLALTGWLFAVVSLSHIVCTQFQLILLICAFPSLLIVVKLTVTTKYDFVGRWSLTGWLLSIVDMFLLPHSKSLNMCGLDKVRLGIHRFDWKRTQRESEWNGRTTQSSALHNHKEIVPFALKSLWLYVACHWWEAMWETLWPSQKLYIRHLPYLPVIARFLSCSAEHK
jgi:hypothetical protein